MFSPDAVFAVLADVSRRADNGDEEAALQLNRIAEGCSPQWLADAARSLRPVAVHPQKRRDMTLGELLGQALGWAAEDARADEFAVIDAAAQAIGDDHGLGHIACLSALFDLEQEALEAGEFLGLLGLSLQFATLSGRVAHAIRAGIGSRSTGDLARAVCRLCGGDSGALAEVTSINPLLGLQLAANAEADGSAAVRVGSINEARQLSPGTLFVTPDNRVKVR